MKVTLAALASLAALGLAACGGSPPAPGPDAAAGAAATPAAETPAAPAEAATPPPMMGPAAGKWKITIATAGMTLPAHEICFDKQMTLAEAQAKQQQSGVTCSEQTFTPAGNGFQGHSVCNTGTMTITSDTTVSGDFNTAYTMDVTATMDPAPKMVPNPSTTKITMERIGDCTP